MGEIKLVLEPTCNQTCYSLHAHRTINQNEVEYIMATMKAAQVSKAGGKFELVDKPIPEPQSNQVLIKVEACGICHSDYFVKEGVFPGIQYPRVPGHEVIGKIVKTGSDVQGWKEGERVGVGWHGGHCFHCEPCRKGDFINCENAQISGISYDGGYAEYMTAPFEALARVPAELSSADAAPLLCAGITTYNALRNSGAKPGALVAVLGIGGLGHLALQYCRAAGYRTIALSHGSSKEALALELGAHYYINTEKMDPAKELAKMGGADVILATAPNSKAISHLVGGLSSRGNLVIVAAAADNMEVVPFALLSGKRISGWPSGHAKESEETLEFSAMSNIRPKIETFPLEKVNEAYDKMITNKVRFRAVLTME